MLEASKPNNKLKQRRVGQRLRGNCTFKDTERISICDGGASDHVEVTNEENSRGAPNTISWWHEVVCGVVVTPLLYKAQLCGQIRGGHGLGWVLVQFLHKKQRVTPSTKCHGTMPVSL